jgi:hypothetical protein
MGKETGLLCPAERLTELGRALMRPQHLTLAELGLED